MAVLHVLPRWTPWGVSTLTDARLARSLGAAHTRDTLPGPLAVEAHGAAAAGSAEPADAGGVDRPDELLGTLAEWTAYALDRGHTAAELAPLDLAGIIALCTP